MKVIHLAATLTDLFTNKAQKVEFYHKNVVMNNNFKGCCCMYKVDKLVLMLL